MKQTKKQKLEKKLKDKRIRALMLKSIICHGCITKEIQDQMELVGKESSFSVNLKAVNFSKYKQVGYMK